ncbi:hypothetical protein TIFTF001_013728 [Ficus carica]|uniref:Glutaminyl-peptide cyclotransferase n=1 Tax=Ficus carica TaxID=3494 RepID=A0AA87ZYA3_FICCA|nr:hypothetical protein TIFTF001_013728 [Ficus carica]
MSQLISSFDLMTFVAPVVSAKGGSSNWEEFLKIKVFLGTFVVDLKELVLTFELFCLSIMLPMRGCRLSLVFKKFAHQMKDGWGLATDGKVMFGSDGTSTLYKIDPQTMKVIDKQIVKFNGKEVHNLNELEFINGEVWANVWETDCIARISHDDGGVLGWILLPSLREGLIRKGYHNIDVLNGIAWDNDKNRIFVTGKLWPRLYEIKLHPFQKQPSRGSIERLCLRAPHDFSRP